MSFPMVHKSHLYMDMSGAYRNPHKAWVLVFYASVPSPHLLSTSKTKQTFFIWFPILEYSPQHFSWLVYMQYIRLSSDDVFLSWACGRPFWWDWALVLLIPANKLHHATFIFLSYDFLLFWQPPLHCRPTLPALPFCYAYLNATVKSVFCSLSRLFLYFSSVLHLWLFTSSIHPRK